MVKKVAERDDIGMSPHFTKYLLEQCAHSHIVFKYKHKIKCLDTYQAT